MHIPIKNNHLTICGKMVNCSRKTQDDKKIGGAVLLSKEVSNVVGGLTDNHDVITPMHVIALNNRSGSGFSSIPKMKSKKSRNNLKFSM